jgi:hypothetical protein
VKVPAEIRHLLFRPPEVVLAITEYSRRMRTPLPSGSVLRCGVQTRGVEGVQFTMVIAPADANEPASREVVVEGPVLAAALILFCRDRRIPLPSDAEKSLQKFGDMLGLVVTRNPRRDQLPKINPL